MTFVSIYLSIYLSIYVCMRVEKILKKKIGLKTFFNGMTLAYAGWLQRNFIS